MGGKKSQETGPRKPEDQEWYEHPEESKYVPTRPYTKVALQVGGGVAGWVAGLE